MNKEILNNYNQHEALDRVYLIICMLEMSLLEHSFIQQNEDLKLDILQVLDILSNTYHKIGSLRELTSKDS